MKNDGKELGAVLKALGVVAPVDFVSGSGVENHISQLDDLLELAAGERQRIGELLCAAERISAVQLEAALAEQRRSGGMLGDVMVGMGLLAQHELDVVLEFQNRQASLATSTGKLRLGNLLVATGQITNQQLCAALKRQKTHGERLGDALVACGYATPKQVEHGLSLQQRLVANALIAAIALAALPMPPAEAGQANASLQVSAIVIANARVQTDYQATQLTITESDVAQGYIDVPAASRFSVLTNSRSGYLTEFLPIGDVFQAVQIRGMGHTTQLGADGGTVIQRGALNMIHELSYRFILRSGLQPGNYPWPLALSVRAL